MDKQAAVSTVDEYIALFPAEVQKIMQEVRAVIHKAAPAATEKISWAMPTFAINGHYFIHFAGHKKHLGIYPGAEGVEHFKKRFDTMGLRYSKGAVQLPYSQPMPYSLIREMAVFGAARFSS